MMLSKSDSKYVRGRSWRRTFVIENSSENLSELLNDNSSETFNEVSFLIPSENSFENLSEKQSCLKTCCNCSLL